MAHIITYDQERLDLQARLDASRTQAERNRFGQFATPTNLANEMLVYARRLLPAESKVRFLDPAFGIGSFYSALLRTFPSDQVVAAEGFEIDRYYGEAAIKLWGDKLLKLHLSDFTRTKAPAIEEKCFNLIICNPPYVRHHHIAMGEKLRLQQLTKQACGVHIGALAGLYCYFLGLCHAWMVPNGYAGWLIPSEFMDVNYGKAVKQYLINQVTILRIHRFDPNEVQFEDALVSSTVVWFRKAEPSPDHQIEFTFGGSLASPKVCKMLPLSSLRREPKWTRFPLASARESEVRLTLNDLFIIKRGLATGDNSFFILTREQIEKYRLPEEFFRPILASPRHLRVNEVVADDNGRPLLEPQKFLLDCRLPEEEIKVKYPTLWKYLEMGRDRGVHNRYLCRHRTPWYVQENRSPSNFICTYMGRIDAKTGRPFRFILNYSNAIVTNVYLLMYPKPVLAHPLQEKPDLNRKVWQALNSISPTVMLGEGRVYGGGLHKIEPRELGNIPADAIKTLLLRMTKGPASQLNLFA